MEDMIIKKKHFAYMLRVDCPKMGNDFVYKDFDDMLKWFNEWMDKYDCKYYIVGHEISDKGKEHLQCIVWFDHLLASKEKSIARTWWLKRCAKTKQPVAFTSAKKIVSLAAYSKKDNNYETNLHKDEIEKIGEWKKKNNEKAWKDELAFQCEEIVKYLEENKEDYPEYDEVKTSYDTSKWLEVSVREQYFLETILELYRENNKRPRRNDLIHLMWKYKIIKTSKFICKLNIL